MVLLSPSPLLYSVPIIAVHLYVYTITSLCSWLCNVTTDDRERLGVSSYGVSQTTMEEVFLKVGKGSTNVLYVLVRLYHQIFIVICICYTVMATKSRVVCLVLFQLYNYIDTSRSKNWQFTFSSSVLLIPLSSPTANERAM